MTGYRAIAPLARPIDTMIRPPGSKSETIRALLAAALATGRSRLERPLDSEDTDFARRALEQLGVEIESEQERWTVKGSAGVLRPAPGPIDAGASGLTARAMIAVAALIDGNTTVVGRDRLPERPMGGLVQALRALGVEAVDTGGRLPVTVLGTGALPGGTVEVASDQTTQFATALLMAAPLAEGPLHIVPTGLEGSHRYLDMTLETMHRFGARVDRTDRGYRGFPTGYTGSDLEIEPDASAAVYPMVAAAISGGRVTIDGLGAGSIQPDMAVAGVLAAMGCHLSQSDTATTVDARGRRLQPIDVDLSGSPDGSLAVAVAALFAAGASRLRGLGSLRFKESDRLSALATEMTRLGAGARIEGTELVVTPAAMRPARIETYGDHRIAMSFALVGLGAAGIEIADPEVVAKTWPGFWDMLDCLSEPDP
ncbi:MAG TPA: 3-phosphoshikimate 1-carboxyvinyltransferase [Acidimicrobiia bacterium]|nr:3-phosphoshikimate 1-carboxyvinyltransferase [Acidimicrobiia bacterium]